MEADQIDFKTIITQMQLNDDINNEVILRGYLEKIFEELLVRMELTELTHKKKISKSVFADYIKCSLMISYRIFNAFTSQDFMSFEDFSDGLVNLYFGSLETLQMIIFKILSNKDKIYRDDVIMILEYFNKEDMLVDNTEIYISEFFGVKTDISFEEFVSTIESFNSDLFILILIFLYRKQPFTKQSIKFYESYKNIELNMNFAEQNQISKKSSKYIKLIRKENVIYRLGNKISFLLKTTFNFPVEQKSQQNFDEIKKYKLNSLENSEKIQSKYSGFLSTKSLPLNLTQDTKSKSESNDLLLNLFNSEDFLKEENFAYFFKNINCFKTTTYLISPNNNLLKYKIVIVDQDLFSFSYSYSDKNYVLERIIHLSGYFPSSCDILKFDDSTYYPVALIPQYGKPLTYRTNIFIFKNETKMKALLDKLKETLFILEIKNYYKIKSKIGKGGFGLVRLGENKKTKEKVAIKIIEKRNLKSKIEVNLVKNEIDVLKYLQKSDHCNIIKIFDIFEDKNCIYLVMEYMEEGNLTKYIKTRGKVEIVVRTISLQIARGLDFLAKSFIVHRDIKPDNILVSHNFQDNNPAICVKISDFGLSKVIGCHEVITNERYGTLIFASPEILSKKGYNHKIDCWSYGVTLYYLFFGHYPFDGNDLEKIAKKIINFRLVFPIIYEHSSLGKVIKTLLLGCLNKNPNERLSLNMVIDIIQNTWTS